MFHKPGNHGPLGPCANDCPACLRRPRARRMTYDSPEGQRWMAENKAAREAFNNNPPPRLGPVR